MSRGVEKFENMFSMDCLIEREARFGVRFKSFSLQHAFFSAKLTRELCCF
jgi:hypothetical protein